MRELVVISGKGGTGKTSITAAFAALAERAVAADCDVDAADLHLLLEPTVLKRTTFTAGKEARIRQADCIGCGACLRRCRFDAVTRTGGGADEATFTVDPIACEGCGVCLEVCPVDAIDFDERICGEWFVSDTRCAPMVHARLGVAAGNSGKLVTLVRNAAKRVAQEQQRDLVLIDGSPGIGCPVIASVAGASLVLVVTEPTLSGIHDLERVMTLVEHFKIPATVCISKSDINLAMSARIEVLCAAKGLELAGKIPYDVDVTKAQVARRSVVEFSSGPAADAIRRLWKRVEKRLRHTEPITETRLGTIP